MLLKQLEYFVCVVDNNSFTQAATEQYVSQSAISQQIKALETSLGGADGTRKTKLSPNTSGAIFISIW